MKRIFTILAVVVVVATTSIAMAACRPGYEYVGSTAPGREICCPRGVGRCGNGCCDREETRPRPAPQRPRVAPITTTPYTGWAQLTMHNNSNVSLYLFVDNEESGQSAPKNLSATTQVRVGWHSFQAKTGDGTVIDSGTHNFRLGDSFSWSVTREVEREVEREGHPEEPGEMGLVEVPDDKAALRLNNQLNEALSLYVDEKFMCRADPQTNDCYFILTPGLHKLKVVKDSGDEKVRWFNFIKGKEEVWSHWPE
jgi:hypothetical protein